MNKERFLHTLGLPEDVLKNVPTVELTGNSRMLVQGCMGVLLYSQGEVCLNLGSLQLSVKGDELSLTSLGENMAQIDGTILDVSFS